MKYTTRLLIIAYICLRVICINAQSNYDLWFVKEKFDSIKIYSSALSSQEDYYWNSYLIDRSGNPIEALTVIENAFTKFPGNSGLEKLKANIAFNSGQYPLCKDLLMKYSSEPEYYLKYIRLLEFENDHRAAIESLEERFITDSLNLEFLTRLGDNYYQIDSLESAKRTYQKILSLNPNDQSTAFKLINILLKQKEYYNALTLCNNALSQDSANRRFIRQKGIASFNLSIFETSEKCFNNLLIHGDSGVFILKHLGISEFNNNSFKKARQHLLLAYSQEPDDFETCFFIGRSYLNSPHPQ